MQTVSVLIGILQHLRDHEGGNPEPDVWLRGGLSITVDLRIWH